MDLLVVGILLQRAQEVAGGEVVLAALERVLAQRPRDRDVGRARLLTEGNSPVLVGVLLEELARIERLRGGEAPAGPRERSVRPEREAGRRFRQESLHVDLEVRGLEGEDVLTGTHEVVLVVAALGVEDGAKRAERDREAVGELRGV